MMFVTLKSSAPVNSFHAKFCENFNKWNKLLASDAPAIEIFDTYTFIVRYMQDNRKRLPTEDLELMAVLMYRYEERISSELKSR